MGLYLVVVVVVGSQGLDPNLTLINLFISPLYLPFIIWCIASISIQICI